MKPLSVYFTLFILILFLLSTMLVVEPAASEPEEEELGSPSPEWWHAHGGGFEDVGSAVKATTDGGYIVTGWTKSYGRGSADAWLVKTNSTGAEEWNRTYGGKGFDFGEAVVEAPDGGFVITGSTESYSAGLMDAWLLKTDKNGTELWNKTFGGEGDDKGISLQNTTDGGYIITGYRKPGVSGWRQLWVIKTDTNGTMEWERVVGGAHDDEGWAVLQTDDGGFIVSGYTKSAGAGEADVWLVALNSSGAESWNATYGGIGDDLANSMIATSDGGYLIIGQTKSFGQTYNDFDGKTTANIWLIKINRTGSEVWNRSIGNIWYEYGEAGARAEDGGYYIAGSYGSYHGENFDIFLIKTDANGTEQWSKIFGGRDYDFTYGMALADDGGLTITGSIGSAGAGGTDMVLLKFDAKKPAVVINKPPRITITSPADNATVSGNLRITGTADDDSFYTFVEVKIDDGSWVLVSEDRSWFNYWNTSGVANGVHTITARAWDTGLYSNVTTINVIVDNEEPKNGDEEPKDEEPDTDTKTDKRNDDWEKFLAILVISIIIVAALTVLAMGRKE